MLRPSTTRSLWVVHACLTYITTDTALTIYKQMIIPLFDYADFMVESDSKVKIAKLEKLQEKALKCNENMCQKRVDVDLLYEKYGIHPCV